jgi:hypothetical protein
VVGWFRHRYHDDAPMRVELIVTEAVGGVDVVLYRRLDTATGDYLGRFTLNLQDWDLFMSRVHKIGDQASRQSEETSA